MNTQKLTPFSRQPAEMSLPTSVPDWGHYYRNAKASHSKGLRVALFVAYDLGIEVFRTALKLQRLGIIQIVGVATDDLLDPNARISKSRRSWKYFSLAEQATLQARVEDLAGSNGIDCFTGNIKSEFFTKDILKKWNPSAILMFGFGQLVPPVVFEYPALGMYNCHPSDLANHKYAGPDPFGDLVRNKETSTVISVHHVNAEFDQGRVIGNSPSISLLQSNSPEHLPLKQMPKHLAPLAGKIADVLLRELSTAKEKIQDLNFVKALGEK